MLALIISNLRHKTILINFYSHSSCLHHAPCKTNDMQTLHLATLKDTQGIRWQALPTKWQIQVGERDHSSMASDAVRQKMIEVNKLI